LAPSIVAPVYRLARAQKGLQDVLFSKIGKSQRDPAIMLVASVIEVSDFVWCLKEDKETQEKGKFFLIVVNLVRRVSTCKRLPDFSWYNIPKREKIYQCPHIQYIY
jgi:hypothetical protein